MASRLPYALVFAIACLAGCSGEADKTDRTQQQSGGADGRDDGPVVTEVESGGSLNATDAREEAGGPMTRATNAAEIPTRFRGEWRQSRAACGNARDTMGVTVTANRVLFYESEGKLRSVRATGDDTIAISADYTGEGDSWTKASTLRLTDAGDLMMDDMKRVRCG